MDGSSELFLHNTVGCAQECQQHVCTHRTDVLALILLRLVLSRAQRYQQNSVRNSSVDGLPI